MGATSRSIGCAPLILVPSSHRFEVETRMTELQKKMNHFPNRDLVDAWARQV